MAKIIIKRKADNKPYVLARIRFNKDTAEVKMFHTTLNVDRITEARVFFKTEGAPPTEHIPSWVDKEGDGFRIFPSDGPEARYVGNMFDSSEEALRALVQKATRYFDEKSRFMCLIVDNITKEINKK